MTWTLATYARRYGQLRSRRNALEREVRLLRKTVRILARGTATLQAELDAYDEGDPVDFALDWPAYWAAHPELVPG